MKTIFTFCISSLIAFLSFNQIYAQSPEIKPVYSVHELGGYGYGFYDATTYQGELYAAQAYLNCTEVRLIKMKPDEKGDLSFGDHWKITGGGTYSDIETVEWNGKLLVFWKNKVSDKVYYAPFDGNEVGTAVEVKLPTHSHRKIATTVFNYKLYLVYHDLKSNKLHILETDKESPGENDWTHVGNVRNGTNDNITLADDKGDYYGNDDTWDVATWYGKVNGEDGELFVVGRVHNGKIMSFSTDGDWGKWNNYTEIDKKRRMAFGLKMIQGTVKGTEGSQDATGRNPMLFAYCSKDGKGVGEMFLQEFLPEENKFPENKFWYTDVPYGYFGMAPGFIRKSDDTYRVQINIIRGMEDGKGSGWTKNYAARIESNLFKIKRLTFTETDELYKNAELRKLITCVGIIEGAPPTLVNSEDWFHKISDIQSLSEVTQLIMSKGEERTQSESKSFITEIELTAGKEKPKEEEGGGTANKKKKSKLGGTFSIGFGFEKDFCKATVDTQSEERIFSTTNTLSQQTATILYQVPIIDRFELSYMDTRGNLTPNTPEYIFFKSQKTFIEAHPVSLNDSIFGIYNAGQLENWVSRPHLDMEEIAMRSSFNLYNSSTEVISLGKEITKDTTTVFSLNIGGKFEQSFFSAKASFSFKSTSYHSSTFRTGVKMILNALSPYTTPENSATKYKCDMYLLDNNTWAARNYYYPKLLKAKYIIEGETPWIVAWRASDIMRIPAGTTSSAIESCFKNGKLECFSSSSGRKLTIRTTLDEPDTIGMELYDMSGHLIQWEHPRLYPKGENLFIMDVSDRIPGMYLLKVITSHETITQKVIKK